MSKASVKVFNRVMTVLLWVVALYLTLVKEIWYLFGFILALHTIEIFIKGYKSGIKAGYSGIYSILMTLIWGFTWWLYLDETDES